MSPSLTQLLFFDTFSHDQAVDEDVNVDLIKFSARPVVIREIRVLPSLTSVCVEPNNFKQGFTFPQAFTLEIFANNLGRSAACTFEKVGCYDYRYDKEIKFQLPSLIATDGLLIRGRYRRISIAVYGEIVAAEQPATFAAVANQQPNLASPGPVTTASAALNSTGAVVAPPSSTISPSTQVAFKALRVPCQGQTVPTPVAPQATPASLTAWSAPPLQLPSGVAAFNPLVPPPLPVPAPSQLPPYSSTTPQVIPTIQTSVVYAAPFDLSRPPPTVLPVVDSQQQSQQQPPSAGLLADGHVTGSAPVEPASSLTSTTSSHHRHHHHHRKRKAVERTSGSSRYQVGRPIETIGTAKSAGSAPAVVQTSYSSSSGQEAPLEEGEFGDSDEENGEKFGFENISDEECELTESRGDIDESELQEDILKHARFNPHNFEMTPLKYFKSPHLSPYEIEVSSLEKFNRREEYVNFVNEFLKIAKEFSMDRSDKWILALERFLPNLVPLLAYAQEKMHIIDLFDTLTNWAIDGLNVKLAIKHEQPAFIIRHLKAGLKLMSHLLTSTADFTQKLINSDVQHLLLDLFDAEHMSIPLKLQILQVLDASMFFPVGVKGMTERHRSLKNGNSDERGSNLTPYQRLAVCIMEGPGSRVLVAIKVLLKKIRFCETLASFSALVEKVVNIGNGPQSPSANDQQQRSSSSISLDVNDVTDLVDHLQEIWKFYKHAKRILIQPLYSLPVSIVFESAKSDSDPYPFIYQHFIAENFLESLFLLLTCSLTHEESKIISPICSILHEFLTCNSSLLFLMNCGEFTCSFLNTTLQNSDDNHEEELSCVQELAVDISYHLQALRLVDDLMYYVYTGVVQIEVDNPGVLATLQSLYVLTFDNFNQSVENRGKRSVVNVLSNDQNLNSVMPFIEFSNEEEWDNRIKKSACAGYAAELLLLVLQSSDSVNLLKNFGYRLLAITSEDSSSKISEVKQWVEILRKLPNFTYDSVEYLSEKMKSFVQQDSFGSIIPQGLVTSLRILKWLVVSQQVSRDDMEADKSDEFSAEKVEELKYKYALMQMLSCDTLSTLVQIIDKLAELHVINWQQGISLNSRCGSLFYACVLPVLALIRSSVSYLIYCRYNDYQDVSCINPLMKMYAVCCSMLPPTGVVPEATQIQKQIIGTLLAFTQPDIVEKISDFNENSYEILSKSLWTSCIGEILKFTNEAVCNYVAGFSVLCELLPLPLPLQLKEPLSEEEKQAIASKRRYWSAHLTPLSNQLQQIVKDFAITTNASLQQNMRRVCLQLCDLSSTVATIITKAILSVILENCEITETSTGDKNQPIIIEKRLRLPATAGLSYSLNLISYLSSHAPFKIVVVDLLRSKNDSPETEGFRKLLSYFLDIFNYVSLQKSHQICQQQIVNTLQSLCDQDVGLLYNDDGVTYEQITCSLPEPEQLQQICVALLKHIGNKQQSYATVLPSLRIFVMLCEHDYGLFNIKTALEIERKSFNSLFGRLLLEFSGHSSDCISTLSTFLELIKLLQSTSENNSEKNDGKNLNGEIIRKNVLGADFVREIIEWKYGSNSNDDHPLKKLCDLLEQFAKEDDALVSILRNMQNLVATLSDPSTTAPEEFIEPVLPAPLDLRDQFERRQIYVVSKEDNEDRLTSHYWFPTYAYEADDGDGEKVECDLEAIRSQYFPQYDLAEELKRKFAKKRADDLIDHRKKRGIINTSRGERKRFIAPLRGRSRDVGYAPRMLARSNDPFRNRPPNTSRPPSMHVDDFIIAESQSVTSSVRSKSHTRKKSKKR